MGISSSMHSYYDIMCHFKFTQLFVQLNLYDSEFKVSMTTRKDNLKQTRLRWLNDKECIYNSSG